MSDLFKPLSLASGHVMKNRFMLAPLTNSQSHVDGRLSDEEFHWLVKRAEGGFGLTMTCAAHVQRVGQGFPGQLGVWSDDHLPGLTRLAAAIKARSSLAVVQLHHAGIRAPQALTGQQPTGPSADEGTGARALTADEIETLTADFIAAAVRSRKAGFDGVEIHGAHGYVLSSFLSPQLNRRDDRWGGSIENRARIILDIIEGVQAACGPAFSLGLRLSPERFGLKLDEIVDVAAEVLTRGLDYLDMSLWDIDKEPNDEAFQGRTLMSYFTELDRRTTALGVAGKILTAQKALSAIEKGADFPVIGRGAILHHDFPELCRKDAGFTAIATPVTPDYLAHEGLSPAFIGYMRSWTGFVTEDEVQPAAM